MGVPNAIKADSGPASTSKSCQCFCNEWQIKHIIGVPYNPQEQIIVEHTHRILKT